MPGTLTPGQMFDHTGIELSGRSLTYPLDFAAPAVAASVDAVAVMQGGVCTLNDAGEIQAGLGLGNDAEIGAVAGKTPMALFAIQGRDEFDSNSDIGNFSGGVQSVLVASGGYELETTEFVQGVGISYLPNQPLTFGLTGDSPTARGLVKKAGAKYSDEQVIGVVSRAAKANEYNKQVLAFWSVFCPAVNGAAVGNDGATGATGSTGATGATGATGPTGA